MLFKSKTHSTEEPKRKKLTFQKFFLAFVLTGLTTSVGTLGYLYVQTQEQLKYLSTPAGQQELAQAEKQQVLGAVSELTILPDEDPVIATITDVTSLASQSAFYKNAENGDKLLVYQQAKQAFIYSPARNKLVNVGPILVDGSPIGEGTSGAVEPIEEITLNPTAQPVNSEEANDPTQETQP